MPERSELLDAYLARLAREHGWLWCVLYEHGRGVLGLYHIFEDYERPEERLQKIMGRSLFGAARELTLKARLFAITPQIELFYVLPSELPEELDPHQVSKDICLMLSLRSLDSG
mgnify:CR=1 FL=1|jgi:hypothetical protein|nr:MAG: hypothetical protein KatS3mg041_1395 [Bacteroidota bacterium]